MTDIDFKDSDPCDPRIELMYPSQGQGVRIGLCHVRAANDLRVSFDFHRNGWVIQVPTRLVFDPGGEEQDERLVEVAFIDAWAKVPESEIG